VNDAWLRLAAPLIEDLTGERLQRMNDQYDELSEIAMTLFNLRPDDEQWRQEVEAEIVSMIKDGSGIQIDPESDPSSLWDQILDAQDAKIADLRKRLEDEEARAGGDA